MFKPSRSRDQYGIIYGKAFNFFLQNQLTFGSFKLSGYSDDEFDLGPVYSGVRFCTAWPSWHY